ncbi:MAG: hypothetical protein QM648_07065 [Solirubrobacterales bacterium]
MIEIKGQSNESLVLSGEWFEKLRGGESKTRLPAKDFVSHDLQEIAAKKKLFGGESEAKINLTLTFSQPPFVGFVTEAEKRPQVDELIAALEAARDL